MERTGRSMTVTERLQNLFFPVLFVGVVGWVSVSMIWNTTHRQPPKPEKPNDPHWERSFKGTWKSLSGDRVLKLKWGRDGRGTATLMRGQLTVKTGEWFPSSKTHLSITLGEDTMRFVLGNEDNNSGVDLYVLATDPVTTALLASSFYRLDGPEDERGYYDDQGERY